jgi:copper transport protein
MHRARLAAALLVLVAAGLALPGPSRAHAEIVSTTPRDGVSLPTSPPALILVFSEEIDPITAVIALLDERGVSVPGLGTLTVDATSTTATVPLPKLPAGLFTVTYRVASADDGHLTEGTWSFLVDPTGTRPAPTGSAASSSLSSGPGIVLARWLALAAALTLFGIVIFWLASARSAVAAAGLPDSAAAAPWGVLAVLGIFAFGGLAAYLVLAAEPLRAGHPAGLLPAGEFPLDFAAPFGSTRFAMAVRVALIGSGAAIWLALGGLASAGGVITDPPRSRSRERAWLIGVGMAGAVVLAGSSLAGHPASIGGPLFGLADWLHLVAVAAWLGTLPGALLLARRARTFPDGRRVVIDAFRRHSRVALVAAPMVALTGLANSPLLLGSSRALATSEYGDLIAAKAFLFSIAIAIGALNFLMVRYGSRGPALRLIAGELVVGGLALLVAATLVTSQPAAHRPAALVRPVIGALQLGGAAGDSAVRLSVNLPAPGVQRYQASIADVLSGSIPTDVTDVTLVFQPPPVSGLAPTRVPLQESTLPGLWGATGAYTPVVGDWHIAVTVARGGRPELTTRFLVPIAELPPLEQVPAPPTGIGAPAPLAVAWQLLPAGTAGWTIPAALLMLLALLQLAVRGGAVPSLGMLRGLLVILAVASGLAVEGRAVLDAANAPSGEAAAATNPTAPSPASRERGHLLYLANCATCHGVDGSGDGPTAAGMLPLPGPFDRLVPTLGDGTLAYRIANGMAWTPMPAFADELSSDDRWDLVNYLRAAFPAVP